MEVDEIKELKEPCPECGGEIKPTINIFRKNEKEFEKFKKACKEEGIPMPKSYNCIKCGLMWNEKGEPMKIRLAWLNLRDGNRF